MKTNIKRRPVLLALARLPLVLFAWPGAVFARPHNGYPGGHKGALGPRYEGTAVGVPPRRYGPPSSGELTVIMGLD